MASRKLSKNESRRSLGEEPPTKRRKTSQAMNNGAFSCFTLDGNDISLHRRSAFSPKRKAEVKGIRRKGACLRCRLLKRACSGDDPCKTCITAARAAANSKALMWMECIRPSFQAINIFKESVTTLDQSRIDSIIDRLSTDDVYLDFHIPFALNVDAASSHLARWLSEDDASPSFSVVGVFSCSSNTNLLQNALDPNLARYLRLFVHLTTHLYTTGMQGGYDDYTDEEIRSVRDCVGDRLLRALDPLVRPAEIEASDDKLGKLRSLFMLLLGTVVGMRYTCSDVFDQTVSQWSEQESKQDALLRLLCHYLIYIGKATALLESSSEEKTLLDRWRTQWNKPAAFTWNCNQGLEMHYRIEPPANWIVSSSEDASLSSIDVDLSEFDDVAMFTEDGDLLKCASCGTLWTELDQAGLCLICQKPEYQDEGFTQLISFESDFDFSMDRVIGFDQQFDMTTPTRDADQPLSRDEPDNGECLTMATETDVDLFPFNPEDTLLKLEPCISAHSTSSIPEDIETQTFQGSLFTSAWPSDPNENGGLTASCTSTRQPKSPSSDNKISSPQASLFPGLTALCRTGKCTRYVPSETFDTTSHNKLSLDETPNLTSPLPRTVPGEFDSAVAQNAILAGSSAQGRNAEGTVDSLQTLFTSPMTKAQADCWHCMTGRDRPCGRCDPRNTNQRMLSLCESFQQTEGQALRNRSGIPSKYAHRIERTKRLLI